MAKEHTEKVKELLKQLKDTIELDVNKLVFDPNATIDDLMLKLKDGSIFKDMPGRWNCKVPNNPEGKD